MQSDLMFNLFFKFSELNLAGVSEDAKEEDSVTPARGHVELHERWTPGCYTALHDMEVRVAMLETIFHIGYKEHSQDAGGSILFLDQTTGSPLSTCAPTVNCFTLVYRDIHTVFFNQYLNCKQLTPYFVLRATYIEKPEHR